MFKNILVPTDGGTLSKKAAAAAIKLAKEQKASITAVFATPPFAPVMYDGMVPPPELISSAAHKQAMAKLATRTLGSIEKLCKSARVKFEGVHVENDAPYEAIVSVARRKRCDLILMASHGRRGLASLVLGSETQKVLTHSKVPVLVYR